MKCSNLYVSKHSVQLSVDFTNTLKQEKDFGFKDKITRSWLSTSSNLAGNIQKRNEKATLYIFKTIFKESNRNPLTLNP
jgi:hypothetical protein